MKKIMWVSEKPDIHYGRIFVDYVIETKYGKCQSKEKEFKTLKEAKKFIKCNINNKGMVV